MSVDNRDSLIGVSAARAARIAGISLSQLSGWEQNGLVLPRVHRELGSRIHVRLYTLDELVELQVAGELARRGIPTKKIRQVVEAHRAAAGGHPLRTLRWAVDGRQVYVSFQGDDWWGGRHPRQGVIVETINLEELRDRGRREARARDRGVLGMFEKRTRTMGGKRVIAGTRTPVEAVAAYIRRGRTDDDILEAFPHLERRDIEAVRTELQSA